MGIAGAWGRVSVRVALPSALKLQGAVTARGESPEAVMLAEIPTELRGKSGFSGDAAECG